AKTTLFGGGRARCPVKCRRRFHPNGGSSEYMEPQDAIVPFTALLMLGLIWVRTRIQYSRGAEGPLRLQRAGQMYFGSAVALLAVGWFAAPLIGKTFWPLPGVTPTL